MGPAAPGELSRDGLERVEAEVSRFERLCEERRDVRLRGYWDDLRPRAPLDRDERLVCLTSLIKSDLRRRFERGEPTAAADYLDEFPELRQADSRVVSLVYEEFCLREEGGEVLDVERFCDRYPDWKDSLIAQLGYHRLLSQAAGLGPPRPRFPTAGGVFEEFELLQQIGRGGYSRVFLARDRSLGGKRVVLKVSVDCGQEAEAQGALDHPHIVPVNSVVYQPDEGLRGLSMPYRPGLPLDEVIRRVGGPETCASARSLWEALASGIREAPPSGDDAEEIDDALRTGPVGDGWRGFPAGAVLSREWPGSPSSWPAPWPTLTNARPTTATSSRATSCSRSSTAPSSWTSTSPNPPIPPRGPRRPSRGGRSRTWPRSRSRRSSTRRDGRAWGRRPTSIRSG